MTEQPAELCAVCQEPASEDRGELVSAVGTVPSGLHASFQNHAGTSCQLAPGRWA